MSERGNMTRRGFLGGLFSGSCLAAQTILMLRSPARYDYYVDDALGDNGNDGPTPATPWQSLNKINTITLSAGAPKKVLVKSGTYDKATDYIDILNNSFAGATLDITFEPGCVMDGTAVTAGTPQKGINSYGTAAAWTTIVQGNGLIIQNYNNTPGSTEGVGTRNNNTTLLYGVNVAGCFQGASSHDSSVLKMYGGSLTNLTAQAIAPVDTSRVEFYGVTINQSAGSQFLADLGANTTSLYEDCIFIPHSTNGNTLECNGAVFRRCRLGTLSARVTVVSTALGTLEDCYLNAYIDGNSFVDMTRCYGLLTTRARNGGSITAQHCVFVGGASGQSDSVLFRNFDPGSHGTWEFTDCVLTGYTNCLGNGFGATDSGYFASAGNFATYINYFGNTVNVDPDLLSAAGASVTTGVITTDPQLGLANSYDQADYAIGPMSPCIGAGSSGGDIGFRLAA